MGPSELHVISAKDDLVWTMWSTVLTDPEVGNKGSVRALQVYRFVNGKLPETWWQAQTIRDHGRILKGNDANRKRG
jgi:hypothetical protein